MNINNAFSTLAGDTLVTAYTFYSIIVYNIINPLWAMTTSPFTGSFTDSSTNNVIFNYVTNFGSSGILIM